MTWDQAFSLSNMLAMLGWIVLLLAPRRIEALGLAVRYAIPLALSVLYTAIVAVHFAGSGGGYGSIAAVRTLLSGDPMLVAGWVHYLAFDLFVGTIVAERMDRVGVHRIVQAPVLVLVFMFGPVGFLAALMIEGVLRLRTRTILKEA